MKREPPFNPSTAAICCKTEENTAAYTCGEGGGMDELLAVLGYKVKSSDMADVANKLEELTKIMCCVDEPGLSSFASDSVHYNPSDISTWVQSMLSDHNPCSSSTTATATATRTRTTTSCLVVDPFYDSDLKAIPGKAILCPGPGADGTEQESQSLSTDSNSGISSRTSLSSRRRCNKKIKLEENSGGGWKTRPVVVVESQENGIRLVHTLMACGEAIQRENYGLAEALVKQVGYFASSQIGSMRKVATYFAQALASRIYKHTSNNTKFDDYLYETLEMHFYEACPYIKFAHFTANQALLEAFSGKKSVHVIDFSMKHGMQWPALMQALALRPEGPPLFRLTAIAPPSPNNNSSDPLQQVGFKLAHFADSLHIQFQYRGFVANCLSDLEYALLNLNPHSQVVAVNSIFELHRLLAKQGGIDKVLGLIKHINPLIFTVVEQEANHNGPLFLDRFNESLHYYSTLFDSLESCPDTQDKLMSEVYLARQISNVLACEGVDRFERHESLPQWRTRLGSSGFEPVHIGSNAYTQASMLLEYFAGGEGYGVEEREGCLMLGWHSRPLITTSAWRPQLHSPTRP